MSNVDMMERVQKLLDKSKSLTELADKSKDPDEIKRYEDEAELFLTKAQRYMLEYDIDAALLAAESQIFLAPSSQMLYVSNPFAVPKGILLNVIAKSFGCKVVRTKMAANNQGVAECQVFGFENEIESTRMIFISSLVLGEMGSARRKRQGYTSRGFQSSYWDGFASGISDQLNASTEEVKNNAEKNKPGAALVLFNRENEVDALVNATFSKLRTTKRFYKNSAGFNAGKQDGRNADIRGNNKIKNNNKALE